MILLILSFKEYLEHLWMGQLMEKVIQTIRLGSIISSYLI